MAKKISEAKARQILKGLEEQHPFLFVMKGEALKLSKRERDLDEAERRGRREGHTAPSAKQCRSLAAQWRVRRISYDASVS